MALTPQGYMDTCAIWDNALYESPSSDDIPSLALDIIPRAKHGTPRARTTGVIAISVPSPRANGRAVDARSHGRDVQYMW